MVIKKNIEKSSINAGNISGVGPRYCPSIEDKVDRFADKDSHQIFLEPEGLKSNLIYPNGISTSLPEDVQEDFLKTIPGLENVKIEKEKVTKGFKPVKLRAGLGLLYTVFSLSMSFP